LLGRPPVWLVVGVLLIGGVTALLGVAFAVVETRLSRVVAYSSVENAGIILVGYGVALAGAATHRPGVVAVGLMASSLQILAHAVAKSSLFAASSFIGAGFDTDDLESLRGVGRRDRWSATTFALGSFTLSGLPPTIGFVSEWLMLEALMQEFRMQDLAVRLSMAFAGALVALTAGVALLCFIRLVGLMVLGRPARERPAGARFEPGAVGRAGLGVLAFACLALAAAVPWVVRFISHGLAPVVPLSATAGTRASPWVLQPVFGNFSAVSPSWLFVLMPIGLLGVGVVTLVLSSGRVLRVRRVPAWRSATAGVAGPDSYSPFAYANILRHVLGNVLGTRRSITARSSSVEAEAGERSAAETDHAHIEVRAEVIEPVEAYLYRPAWSAWLWLSGQAKRLQSGHLHAYIGYMLVALLVVLAIVSAMH
ncbi:MAG: proton-conducting transporter membrane subunit, partial [Acidimicrobiales bacterium]